MSSPPFPAPEAVARLIDHTLLKPEATRADIDRLCDEAAAAGFCSVCVNPVHVRHAALRLGQAPVLVCSVAGFPLGAHRSETKAFEAQRAIDDGAAEVDMVIHVGALRDGDRDAVRRDIAAVVDVCRRGAARCKVILENALLDAASIADGCLLAVEAGADFVKTSTGFGPGGATVADVALMARVVSGSGLGVKAAGGIRTYEDLRLMVEAGATRIGSSAGVRILEEARLRGGPSR
ncbi:MAG TPA: deoxyribose-phosphate aldolase [Vicinamibacterales bacterium]|nr:deoxyribose-phosphate aldolase [Vicinamibacterales bacterium]